MSNILRIPSQLASQVVASLADARILLEVVGEETGYAPARPLEKITAEDVLSALRTGKGEELATADDATRALVRSEYERILLAEFSAAHSVTFDSIGRRALAKAPAAVPPTSQKSSIQGS